MLLTYDYNQIVIRARVFPNRVCEYLVARQHSFLQSSFRNVFQVRLCRNHKQFFDDFLSVCNKVQLTRLKITNKTSYFKSSLSFPLYISSKMFGSGKGDISSKYKMLDPAVDPAGRERLRQIVNVHIESWESV